MTVGSLFSGVGGMDLGLQRAGMRHAFLCELDEWRRSVLTRRFPGVPIHTDVRHVRNPAVDGRRGHLEGTGRHQGTDGASGHARHPRMHVDLLAGGFPCQDLSVAGRRAGLAGERSGLFFEFARIADDTVRPGGWVLIENVPGLFSSNGGRDFAVVLATLADLGFLDGAWRVLDAQHFGVPQRRRRVFILARRAPHGTSAQQVLLESESSGRDPQEGAGAAQGTAGRTPGGVGIVGSLTRPGRLDDHEASSGQLVVHALTSAGHDASEDGTGRGTPLVVNALDRRGGGADDNEAQAGHLITGPDQVRRLTPTECERLMGWPDGWTGPAPDSRRYAACGDGVVSHVAEWIGRRLIAHQQEAA